MGELTSDISQIYFIALNLVSSLYGVNIAQSEKFTNGDVIKQGKNVKIKYISCPEQKVRRHIRALIIQCRVLHGNSVLRII